jgi:RNA polymerase sigma-19 factor, ECF subfamily
VTDDRELFERLRQGGGDQAAFDAIFRAHYPHLVVFAQGLLRQRAAAEDVAQEVMLELWRRRETLVLQDSLRAYLFQSTRNRSLNVLRHARVEQKAEPYLVGARTTGNLGDSLVVQREIGAAVRSAVAELPPRCREVFELSRVHGLKYAEIASSLGISVKTVETQMGRALQLLRARLAAWLPMTKER